MRQKNPIRSLLSRPISFHPILVDICEGSITAGLFLSQAIYYSEATESIDGWFWKKSKEWEKETRLSRRQQDTAKEILERLKFIRTSLRNSPPVMHFMVDFDMLESAILNMCETDKLDGVNVQIDLSESAKTYKESKTTTKNTVEVLNTSQESTPSFFETEIIEPKESSSKNKKESSADPRHAVVADLIFHEFYSANGYYPRWAGQEGKVLSYFLSQRKDWPLSRVEACVVNRFKSEENLSDEPRSWISKMAKFTSGPLNAYGKPKNGSNGNGKSKEQQRNEQNQRDIIAGARAYQGRSEGVVPDGAIVPYRNKP